MKFNDLFKPKDFNVHTWFIDKGFAYRQTIDCFEPYEDTYNGRKYIKDNLSIALYTGHTNIFINAQESVINKNSLSESQLEVILKSWNESLEEQNEI